jgi:hypothetical protein
LFPLTIGSTSAITFNERGAKLIVVVDDVVVEVVVDDVVVVVVVEEVEVVVINPPGSGSGSA